MCIVVRAWDDEYFVTYGLFSFAGQSFQRYDVYVTMYCSMYVDIVWDDQHCCHVWFYFLLSGRFLTSLISAAPDRLGKNGVGEVMASTWLAGVPWERIREMRAPYVTEGAARVKVRVFSARVG